MRTYIGTIVAVQLVALFLSLSSSNYGTSCLLVTATAVALLYLFKCPDIEDLIEERVTDRTNELVEMVNKYERAAISDALTGLLNRRGGEDAISQHITRSKRLGTPFAFIVLDIDHFKSINDKYGHAVGDLVLSGVGNAIKNHVRESDTACRWGGEEFLIALPDTDLRGAARAAEKLRQVIERLDFGISPISASFGCSELGGDIFHVALARADMNLYVAKSQGRNCIFPNKLEKECLTENP